jgi:hypothetical protein
MTNLTEQDNAKLLTQEECLISDINERLKRLEDLYFSKGQETKQPIDTTEGEQEQGKEWKVGEWAWNSYTKTFIGIITKLDLSDIIEITLDNQDGKSSHFAISILLVKPTTEEIQAHLVAIAEKKYKKKDKIKIATGAIVELSEGFTYEIGRLWMGCVNYKERNDIVVWQNGKWAELAPIETEQR